MDQSGQENAEETCGIHFPMADAFVTKQPVWAHINKNTGLHNWTSNQTVISLYFYACGKACFDLYIRCQVLPGEKSTLRLQLQNETKDVTVSGKILSNFKVGHFTVQSAGYYHIDLMGVERDAGFFADVTHLIFEEYHGKILRIHGLREIPSSVLWYQNVPPQVEYIYQELRVPKDLDPLATYFCAQNFKNGYFGIQRNTETESRILFSIWSPQKTDDPNEITEENAVKLLSIGKDVMDEPFGHEGSGRHSILKYNWKTATTYRFLVRGRPLVKNKSFSVYTAWWAEDQGDWNLLASYIRPKSNGDYIWDWCSFLEDFGQSAYLPRVQYVGNQWAISPKGVWEEITTAKFALTGDKAPVVPSVAFDAGTKNIDGSEFFEMKLGGFQKSKGTTGQTISRSSTGKKPEIIFADLP